MKLKLLIATPDNDYAEHISGVLTEKFAESFEVSVCSSEERLHELLSVNKYDSALLEHDPSLIPGINSIRLPFLLIDESASLSNVSPIKHIKKYQRISSIVGHILEGYSEVGGNFVALNANKARITAVWSPAGGVGKTTVALAYAASKLSQNRQVLYLNLENFSSGPVYFPESGKSISKVFEKLDVNVQLFLRGIRQQDSGSGIYYFCGPDNYEDMNILSAEDTETLIKACITDNDELVIDLSGQCDERTLKSFEYADKILLVVDSSSTSQIKMKQFINQHNVFAQIKDKSALVQNRGAKAADLINIINVIQLPSVQSNDPISIYKTLSGGNFDW
jgi:MinD-like ATPase involved in chromosome partitioning or flagellar assembly